MNAELTRVIARGPELLRMRAPIKFMIARDRHDFRRGISVSHQPYRETQPLACVPTDHDEVRARSEGWKPAGAWISKMKVRHDLDLQLLLDCCFSRPPVRDQQDRWLFNSHRSQAKDAIARAGCSRACSRAPRQTGDSAGAALLSSVLAVHGTGALVAAVSPRMATRRSRRENSRADKCGHSGLRFVLETTRGEN